MIKYKECLLAKLLAAEAKFEYKFSKNAEFYVGFTTVEKRKKLLIKSYIQK
jgi:hypothetical protein